MHVRTQGEAGLVGAPPPHSIENWALGSLCVVLLETSSWHDGTPGLVWAYVDPWQGPASLSCPKEQQKSRRSQW